MPVVDDLRRARIEDKISDADWKEIFAGDWEAYVDAPLSERAKLRKKLEKAYSKYCEHRWCR